MKRLLAFLLLLAPFASAQVVVNPGGGGSATSSGSTISGCTSSILYADASSLLKCDPAAVVNGSVSTAGRSILTIRDTISGSSATSNFLNITGTAPATLSADTNMAYLTLALDNDASQQYALSSNVTGTGGGAITAAVHAVSSAAGTYSYSVWGEATGAPTYSVGVAGSSSGAGTNRIGVLGTLSGAALATTAAIVSDNGAVAANIFEARDNGTAVFTIADGGAVTATQGITLGSSGISSSLAVDSYLGLGNLTNAKNRIGWITSLTPDSGYLQTGSDANSWHIAESVDSGFDFQNPCTTGLGTAACTDPTLIVHSHNQDTGEFLSMAHDGKAGVIVGGNSTVLDGTIRLGGTVTLTESSATNVLTIPVAVSTGTGGEIMYTVEAKDATNTQVRRGSVRYAVANNSSGTETCGVYGVDNAVTVNPAQTNDGSGAGAITSGTLTYAWSSDTSGTNSCVLKLNGVSSLTQTTFQIHYTVIQSGPGVSTGGD